MTPEQRAVRDAALVRNLRFKYKQLSNYSDATIVKAYDDWFLSADEVGNDFEDDFLEYLQGDDE